VRMVTDVTGAPRFESYLVAAGGNGAYRGDFVSGTPTAAAAGSGYAPQTGLITIVEVVLAPVWVWLAFGEDPGPRAMIGGAIVLAAVIAHTAFEKRAVDGPAA